MVAFRLVAFRLVFAFTLWFAPLSVRGADGGNALSPAMASADADMVKLNEFIQQDKIAEINVETLYGDLQRRFAELKADWSRGEAERIAMRKSLKVAQAHLQELSDTNRRLTGLLTEVKVEQTRMTRAKATVLKALGLDASVLNLTSAGSGGAEGEGA